MTDKPSTLSLDPTEWRTLLHNNLSRAAEFVQQNANINDENLTAFTEHLERTKALAQAWFRSQPVLQADVTAQGSQLAEQVGAETVEPAKRKGGWPLGKKRTRKQQEAA